MKIVFVIDRIMTGGAEHILVDYYHHMEKNGHEPYVFSLLGDRTQSEWAKDLRVIYGRASDVDNIALKAIQQLLLLFKLRKLIRNVKPEVLFSFLEKSNLLTIVVPALHAKKVVSVHNVLSIQYKKIRQKWVRRILYKMIQIAYNQCPNIIAVSRQVKDDLIDKFKVNSCNIHVVNNFANKEQIRKNINESIENIVFDTNKKYIINIGRYSAQKAQWKLIKAFSVYIENTNADVELILMGAGDFKNSLLKMCANLNIENKVHILPFNTNPYKYMSKADLFVLSSIYEGFPIVLAEISSMRIPFVGYRKAIPEEMFDDLKFWEDCYVECDEPTPDFTLKIHEDEKQLAKLMYKGLHDTDFREKFLRQTEMWESQNEKHTQFELYDAIIKSSKCEKCLI